MTTQQRRIVLVKAPKGEVMVVREFAGYEGLNEPYEFHLKVQSLNCSLKLEEMLGQPAAASVEGAGITRVFHGIVSRFMLIDVITQGHPESPTAIDQLRDVAVYQITLRPKLWFLSHTSDCRIFQNMNALDIIKEVFKKNGLSDFSVKSVTGLPVREYCVQYRESDFNFVSRLMEEEGISYYFTHAADKHTLVLCGDTTTFTAAPDPYGALLFFPASSRRRPPSSVESWQATEEVQSGKYALDDFDFTRPSVDLVCKADAGRSYAEGTHEAFDYPGEYVVDGDGKRYAMLRLKELQWQTRVYSGEGDIAGVFPGNSFTLSGHHRAADNQKYAVLSCHYSGTVNANTSGGSGGNTFRCSFTAIPLATPYVPRRVARKPVVRGPQTAIVVGPANQEIHTDEFGRIKVSFHWDRYNAKDEKSSCWIRVAQVWAGKRWGASFLPRIGQEVIVDFLEGDPDRPIVIGSVYNGEQLPPYSKDGLDNDHKNDNKVSGIKSNTTTGGIGFNELRFDDTKDKEHVFLHAQKELHVQVLGNSVEKVGGERHRHIVKDNIEKLDGSQSVVIAKDQVEKVDGQVDVVVAKDYSATVKGKQSVAVTGECHLDVGAKLFQTAAADIMINAGGKHFTEAAADWGASGANITLNSKGKVVIAGTSEIVLAVGGNYIKIDASGVTIFGTQTKINCPGGPPGPAPDIKADKAKKPSEKTPPDVLAAKTSASGSKSAK